MITEDDDDTHICLKCHVTIHGLDAYVTHRKSNCTTQPPTKPRTLSPLIPPDEPDFSLKADDFFSLLELQSSSKKTSIPVPSGGKTNSGVLTRSKATAVIQATSSRGSDWIGGHQLRELGNEDNQTKLIKAVDNISGNIKKDEPTRISYHELEEESSDDYDEDDYEDHNAPPRNHTGGKWKPSPSPIQWLRPSSEVHEWNSPPPSHTGGKWKPTLPRLLCDDDDKIPPPDHTKGKWIPGKNLDLPSQEDILEPPLRKSSGTVQYWCGPCNRRLASKIVYDRHLKSELHYKRTLHEREFDDYSQNTAQARTEGKRKIKKPNIWSNPVVESTKEIDGKTDMRLKKNNYIRCEVCKTKVRNHLIGKHLISHYHCRRRHNNKQISQQMVLDNILGIVLQSPFQCTPCRFYCNEEQQFLQHWRSEEHLAIVDATMGFFLCSFCKFQTKYNDAMEEHLHSDAHGEVVSVINRSVPIVIKKIIPTKCGTCDKVFRFNSELRQHCAKENHVLGDFATDKYQSKHHCTDCSLVLKSYKGLQRHLVKKHGKNLYFCSVCALIFETDLESKLHRKSSEHKYAIITRNYEKGATNRDITRICEYCYARFPNMMFLKQHLQKNHPEHSYSCPQCGLKFTLSQEVTQHIKTKSCSFPSTSTSCFFNCEKCPYRTNSEADLIFHLALHNDPVPVLYPENKPGGSKGKGKKLDMYRCPICDKIFRKSSLRCHVRQHVNERPYKCDKCKAAYTRKSNLMDHIKARHHEEFQKKQNEGIEEIEDDPPENFDQSQELSNPVRRNEENREIQEREKKYLCANCGMSFLKKFTLQQHSCTHVGKDYPCVQAGCVYHARCLAELRTHISTHSEDRPFACPECSRRTKTKAQLNRHMKIHDGDVGKKFVCPFCTFAARVRSHLKRHLRLHTGAKPYKCPHCPYTCNNLENLRKHILLTNKHPGKLIYTCTWCPPEAEFATNYAKEFHVHLVTAHSDRFDANSAKEAASRLLGIYNKEEDEKVIEDCGNDRKRFKLSLDTQPSVLPSTSTAPAPTTTALVDPELLSMSLVVVKEDVVLVAAEAWPMEGFYCEAAIAGLDEEGMLGSEGFDEDEGEGC